MTIPVLTITALSINAPTPNQNPGLPLMSITDPDIIAILTNDILNVDLTKQAHHQTATRLDVTDQKAIMAWSLIIKQLINSAFTQILANNLLADDEANDPVTILNRLQTVPLKADTIRPVLRTLLIIFQELAYNAAHPTDEDAADEANIDDIDVYEFNRTIATWLALTLALPQRAMLFRYYANINDAPTWESAGPAKIS